MPDSTRSRVLPSLPPRLILTFLILINLIYFGRYATQRYLAFETGAFDLGVYTQPLWNFNQGRGFAVSLIEDNGPMRWATHVEPILFLIAPLYKIWPDPRTLLWLQAAALSLAGLPLYGLAVRRLQNEWVALVVVLAYFLLPATEAVTLFDFHAVALAPLCLLAAIYCLDRALAARGVSFWLWPEVSEAAPLRAQAEERPYGHRPGSTEEDSPHPPSPVHEYKRILSTGGAGKLYALSAVFFVLALATKEDISLHVVMIGLYLILLRRRWWEGGSLILVGLVWFYIAFQIIIPAFRTTGGQSIYIAWFEALGRTPAEIALSPFRAPDKVWALFFRPDSLPALGMLSVPLALLPLAGLPLTILAAPSLAFSLLSQNQTLRQLETWHYAAPMLPFVMLGTLDGLARLSYYLSRLRPPAASGPPATPGRPAVLRFSQPSLLSLVALLLLLLLLLTTTLIYHNLRGYSPLSQLNEWPDPTSHHQLGRELAASIPAEASVLAQAQLVPYVAHRYRLGIWSGPLSTDYDYIWLDLSHPKFPNRFNAQGELLTGLVIEDAFGAIAARDGYLLLKKGAKRVPLAEELFAFTHFDQLPPRAVSFSVLFGDALKLIAVEPEVRRLATSETEPQVVLFFEALEQPPEAYYLFVYLLDQNGSLIGATDYLQPALLWWPTSRWQAGDRRQVRVNTMPWWTGDQTVFGYALGFSHRDDPWDVSARLPLSLTGEAANPAGSQPIDSATLLPIAAFRRLAGIPYPKPLTVLEGPGNEAQVAR